MGSVTLMRGEICCIRERLMFIGSVSELVVGGCEGPRRSSITSVESDFREFKREFLNLGDEIVGAVTVLWRIEVASACCLRI
jgi:hypothetical protein